MKRQKETVQVQLAPWAEEDLPLLRQINAPEMMELLGGSEGEEKLVDRHGRYVNIASKGTGHMFSIILLPELVKVGSIGYWDKIWEGEGVYEMGWSVLKPYQGRGIASAAVTAALAHARNEHKYSTVHAYPSIHNPASNAVCRSNHFNLLQECDFEYPKGHLIRCNDWKLEL
jgi:RimJ/RimL family protein N-acetyltransferase